MKRALASIVLLAFATARSQAEARGDDRRPSDVPEAVAEARKITLALADSDIRDALRMVALQGHINIVMSNSVSGAITLELDQVSLEEALNAIVIVGGFQYSLENGIVTVSSLAEQLEEQKLRREYLVQPEAPPVLEVLLLNLRYIEAERVLPLIEKLLGEGGSATMLQTSDHVTQSHRYAGTPASENGLQIGTELVSTSQGRPAMSHTLVVVDVPERLARIKKIVREVDVMPMSIVIETRFVEIGLDDENRLGIDWNLVAGANGAAAPHTFPFGGSSLGSFGPAVTGGSPGGVFPAAPPTVSSSTSAGLFTFGSLDFSAFSALLEMIQRDSRVEVVSNPRIVVNDRHTATILVGERYPILSANVSEFGTVTEQLDHYEPVGVQLVVTPSILSDDEVELFVRPSSSSLGPIVEGSSGIQVARINSRQIDTAVTIRDGQTVVLGGLITSRQAQAEKRVPFLGSIPLLGKLFTHTSTEAERIDLVVFLTVNIVREPGLTEAQREMFETALGCADVLGPPRERSELEYSASPPQY